MATEVKVPCEAVAVRYVFDVRTEEFLNIGVILMAPDRAFIGCKFLTHWTRVTGAFPGADVAHLRRIARTFERACEAWIAGRSVQLPLLRVDDLEVFLRSTMPPEDASIQVSSIISGLTKAPTETLEELFGLYVGHHGEATARRTRDDADVWRGFAAHLGLPDVLNKLRSHVVRTNHYEISFDRAWVNGQWNVAQPLSFDMADPGKIRNKAADWSGRILTVHPAEHGTHLYFLVGMPSHEGNPKVIEAAADACAILTENLRLDATVLTEDRREELAQKIVTDLAAHENESQRDS